MGSSLYELSHTLLDHAISPPPKKKNPETQLRTFALIIYAHPYCARNPCRNAMLRHARPCTKEEIYSHEGMVAVALTLLRFNMLGWSVTLLFWIDDFLY